MMSSFWGVFWVDVSTEALAAADFFRIAELLQISAQTWRDACRGLSNLSKPWLLVLDNADDQNVDYQCYFPSGTRGITLVTSRNPELRQHATSRYLPLAELSDTATQTLLLAAAGPAVEQYGNLKDDATKVARLLASHPLAIIQAGAYISRRHCTIAQYPHVYERQRRQLLRYRPSHARSRYGDVYTTFEASADILQSSNDEAARDALQLLPILAALSPSRVPLSLFGVAWQGVQWIQHDSNGGEAAESKALRHLTPWHVSKLPQLIQVTAPEWDSFRLLEAVYLLEAFSLTTVEKDDGGLNLSSHPLVHAWARDRQGESEQHQGWLISSCLVVASVDNHSYWRKQERRLQPHLQALVAWTMSIMFAQEPPEMIVTILLKCAHRMYLNLMGNNQLSLSLTLMRRVCSHLGLDATTVSRRWRLLYFRMARALLWCEHPIQAVTILEEILTMDEQTCNEHTSDRLEVQHFLALALDKVGDTQKAVEILQAVIKMKKQILKETDQHLLASQHELARIYGTRGQIEDALVLMKQVVESQQKCLAEDDSNRLASELILAECYAHQGLLDQAYSRLQHIVNVQRRVLPEDHTNRLIAEHELARFAWDLGFHEQGFDLVKHVVDVERKVLDEKNTRRLESEHDLAAWSWTLGLRNEGYKLMKEVAAFRTRTLDEDSPDRLTSEHCLAIFTWDLGSRDDAYTLMTHVVNVQRRVLDETHPNRIKSEHALAIYGWQLGDRERAYTLMQHVVNMRRLTLTADNARLVTAEDWLHGMETEREQATHARRDNSSDRSSLDSDSWVIDSTEGQLTDVPHDAQRADRAH